MDMLVENIPLNDIHDDDEFNCRGKITPIDVVDLAKDIARQGLIQPIILAPYPPEKVAETSKKYRLIAGYRRYTAFVILSKENEESAVKYGKIPSIVRSDMVNDTDARFFNLAENLQRSDLNVLQEAKAIEKLKNIGITDYDCAQRLGKSRGWVQIRFMLLGLPKEVQVEVALGNIVQTQIRELYTIFNKAGLEACFAAAKEIKEAKARGRVISVNPNKNIVRNSKHIRKRTEIFMLMENIQGSGIGNGLWTRCLAWAAGEIDDETLYMSLEDYASKNNLRYSRPTQDELIGANNGNE